MVGQSLGGAVALAYALDYQDEMSGLVLLAPVSHEWPGDVAWYNKASGCRVAGFLPPRVCASLRSLTAEKNVAKCFAGWLSRSSAEPVIAALPRRRFPFQC
ncbi:MAG: alpha/beta fold hydrolase [Parvularculaceae bacterium]